jgi:hypothetical protein
MAQGNFISCSAIDVNGDTLKGSIDYRNWEKNPETISFIKAGELNAINLNPLDVKSFKVKGDYYVSGMVLTESSSNSTNDLDYNPQLITTTDTVFLMVLFEGKKGLYYLKNAQGIENYYIKNNDDFELLVYKAYFKDIDLDKVKVENKKFVGQLLLYLNDWEQASEIVHKALYTQKSLASIFQKYYEAKAAQPQFVFKPEKTANHYGLMAGMAISNLEFSSVDYPSLEKTKFDPHTSFAIGAYIDFPLPRNLARWSIKTDLLITSYKFNGEYLDMVNENNYTKTDTYIKFSYLKIMPMLRYKHKVSDLHLFANMGPSIGLATTYSAYRNVETKFYEYSDYKSLQLFNPPKKMEFSVGLGAGVIFRQFLFEARLEKGNGISNYMGTSSRTTRYYFLLGYQFK